MATQIPATATSPRYVVGPTLALTLLLTFLLVMVRWANNWLYFRFDVYSWQVAHQLLEVGTFGLAAAALAAFYYSLSHRPLLTLGVLATVWGAAITLNLVHILLPQSGSYVPGYLLLGLGVGAAGAVSFIESKPINGRLWQAGTIVAALAIGGLLAIRPSLVSLLQGTSYVIPAFLLVSAGIWLALSRRKLPAGYPIAWGTLVMPFAWVAVAKLGTDGDTFALLGHLYQIIAGYFFLQGALALGWYQPQEQLRQQLEEAERTAETNAWLFRQAQRQGEEMEKAFAQIGKLFEDIGLSTQMGDVVKESANYMTEALEADVVSIFLVTKDGAALELAPGVSVLAGEKKQYALAPEVKRLLTEGEPFQIADLQADGLRHQLPLPAEATSLRSLAVLPLTVQNRVLGVALAGFLQLAKPLSAERLQVARLVAQQAALAVDNSRVYQEIREMALTDTLTGLANRRRFDAALENELERAHRFNRPLSLLMLDLDYFKKFNDAHGHLAGDQVLTRMGEVLRRNLRSVDLPARYGGEEFVVILPETGMVGAAATAERIREAMERESFAVEPGHLEQVTVSIGGVTYLPLKRTAGNKPDGTAIVGAADRALYSAKQSGRNRVNMDLIS